MDNFIPCPFCKHQHSNWQDYIETNDMEGSFAMQCDGCGKIFFVTFETTIKFKTSREEE